MMSDVDTSSQTGISCFNKKAERALRVLIVEPHATGHHASYLRWLVEAAVHRQWSVAIATTREALSHPLLSTIESDFRDTQIHIIENLPATESSTNRFRLLKREFAYWGAIKRIAIKVRNSTRIDAAILAYIDYCFHAIAIVGSPFQNMPWCGISMRLSVGPAKTNGTAPLPMKWRMAKRILGSSALKTLFVINPSVQDAHLSWLSDEALSKLSYLPDPAEHAGRYARISARSALGISHDAILVLVFGSIDERKGIEPLLKTLLCQGSLENYVVILAGKHSVTIKNRLRDAPYESLLSTGRLVLLDHFVTTDEQELVFAAADVVWVGYRNHIYMSGVLVLAGMAGLPVIGTANGEIGQLISRHSLGEVVNIDSPTDVTRALRVMLDANHRLQIGRRAEFVFKSHSVENFKSKVFAAWPSAVA